MVLGLIFLKYVSDAFTLRRAEIEAALRSPVNDYFVDPDDYGGHGQEGIRAGNPHERQERDYYIERNVFWVPALARWKTLQDSAKLPPGTEIEISNGKKTAYKITSDRQAYRRRSSEEIEREEPEARMFSARLYPAAD